MFEMNQLDRRSFLKLGASGLALAGPLGQLGVVAAEQNPYGAFKMGIQSYSLRGFQVTDDALAKTKELGLRYWESYSAHFPMTDAPATLAEYKKKLADHGITLMAYGVQNFGKDTSANRKQFEFAKAMGISTISANPEPDSFDNLDKLVEEFGINIAIHNHGSNDKRYGKVDQVLKAIMNHNERIGACVDTGHYIHADEDPVKAIEAFGHRTYGVHLKDVKKLPDGKKEYTVLGRGDLDVVGCLKQLKRLKFDLCLSLEYEGNEKNPIADIRECLAVVQEAVKKV